MNLPAAGDRACPFAAITEHDPAHCDACLAATDEAIAKAWLTRRLAAMVREQERWDGALWLEDCRWSSESDQALIAATDLLAQLFPGKQPAERGT